MRAAFVAIAVFSASSSIFFACNDETPVTPGSPAGFANDTGAPSSDAGGGGAIEDVRDDRLIAPNGCLLKTTDYKSGAKAENIPRDDLPAGVPWTNVEGALSEDGNFATVTLDDNQESAELRVSQYGISIPENADTWGIEVQLKRRAPSGGIVDSKIDIVIDGQVTAWKFLKGPWPTSIVGTHHYGQAVDTWGIDLLPTQVNKVSFGAKVWAKKAPGAPAGPVIANVDSLKVAVYYCPK